MLPHRFFRLAQPGANLLCGQKLSLERSPHVPLSWGLPLALGRRRLLKHTRQQQVQSMRRSGEEIIVDSAVPALRRNRRPLSKLLAEHRTPRHRTNTCAKPIIVVVRELLVAQPSEADESNRRASLIQPTQFVKHQHPSCYARTTQGLSGCKCATLKIARIGRQPVQQYPTCEVWQLYSRQVPNQLSRKLGDLREARVGIAIANQSPARPRATEPRRVTMSRCNPRT